MMISEIINNDQSKYLVIKGEKKLCPDYMTKMLERGECSIFLPLLYDKEDELIYDSLDMMSLDKYIEKNGFSLDLLKILVKGLQELFLLCDDYLLDASFCLLDPTHIYIANKKDFRFLFNPFVLSSIKKTSKQVILEVIGRNYLPYHLERALKEEDWDFNEFISLLEKNQEQIYKNLEEDMEEEPLDLKNIEDIEDNIKVGKKDINIGKVTLINDKKLKGPYISLRHASLRYSGKTLYVKDHKSKYGTYVNGDRIETGKFVPVNKGDIVAFGDQEYILL